MLVTIELKCIIVEIYIKCNCENPAFNVVYVYVVFLICFKTNHV